MNRVVRWIRSWCAHHWSAVHTTVDLVDGYQYDSRTVRCSKCGKIAAVETRGGSDVNRVAEFGMVLAAALCFFGCAREVAQMSRPEKIIDATHVQTRDGKIHTVLESHEP